MLSHALPASAEPAPRRAQLAAPKHERSELGPGQRQNAAIGTYACFAITYIRVYVLPWLPYTLIIRYAYTIYIIIYYQLLE